MKYVFIPFNFQNKYFSEMKIKKLTMINEKYKTLVSHSNANHSY